MKNLWSILGMESRDDDSPKIDTHDVELDEVELLDIEPVDCETDSLMVVP